MNHRHHQKEYVYHWRRIFGAAFVGIGVLGLLGYGTYQWLTPDPIDTPLRTAVERLDLEPSPIAANPPTPEPADEHAPEDTALLRDNASAAAVGVADVGDDARVKAQDNATQAATADPADATVRLETLPAPAAGVSPDAARGAGQSTTPTAGTGYTDTGPEQVPIPASRGKVPEALATLQTPISMRATDAPVGTTSTLAQVATPAPLLW